MYTGSDKSLNDQTGLQGYAFRYTGSAEPCKFLERQTVQVFFLVRSRSEFWTGMVSLLSRFVLTPEPCKFLHNFRGKGLEPCYASLVKKATPMLTWLLTLAKIRRDSC